MNIGDGRPEFYRHLDVDKKIMKILYAFRDLKIEMLNERYIYSDGTVLKDDRIEAK